MATVYRLVGYDRISAYLEERHDIPAAQVARAKRAAGITPSENELPGDWPLSDFQAQAIADLIKLAIDLKHREYFLEPYVTVDDSSRRSHETHAG